MRAAAKNWLRISEAARELDIHPTTLRRWAENGEIPVMTTPGGHRRFAPSDLAEFGQKRRTICRPGGSEKVWVTEALTLTRREIQRAQQLPWLAKLDEKTRARSRALGQRLLGRTLQFISDPEQDKRTLAETRAIAQELALAALSVQLPLTQALQASMFFRESLIRTTLQLPERARIRPETMMRFLIRINKLVNTVQLTVAEIYDARNRNHLSGS